MWKGTGVRHHWINAGVRHHWKGTGLRHLDRRLRVAPLERRRLMWGLCVHRGLSNAKQVLRGGRQDSEQIGKLLGVVFPYLSR